MDNFHNKNRKVVPQTPKYKQEEQTTKRHKTYMVLRGYTKKEGSKRATLMAFRIGKSSNSQQVLTGTHSWPI